MATRSLMPSKTATTGKLDELFTTLLEPHYLVELFSSRLTLEILSTSRQAGRCSSLPLRKISQTSQSPDQPEQQVLQEVRALLDRPVRQVHPASLEALEALGLSALQALRDRQVEDRLALLVGQALKGSQDPL